MSSITALPQYTTWNVAKFNNPNLNTETKYPKYSGLDAIKVPGLSLPEDYRLVRSGNEYIVLNDAEKLVTYFARLATANRKLLSYMPAGLKTVSQVNVWRAPRDPKMDGVVTTMFLYYLSQYGVIVTDSEQTVKGKEMWQRMTEYALDNNDYLYYANFNNEPVDLLPITTEAQLYDFFSTVPNKSAWGQGQAYGKQLLFISKNKLKTSITVAQITAAIQEVIDNK
ncbi:hypothetical protein KFS98_003661 [Salmonella enterica]|nr:hypothetical protein [Salmonella enterica]